jgi:hypothetical protein
MPISREPVAMRGDTGTMPNIMFAVCAEYRRKPEHPHKSFLLSRPKLK